VTVGDGLSRESELIIFQNDNKLETERERENKKSTLIHTSTLDPPSEMNLITTAGRKARFLTAFVIGVVTLLAGSSSAHKTFIVNKGGGHPTSTSTSTRNWWGGGRLPTTASSTLRIMRGGDKDTKHQKPASPPPIKFFQRITTEALVTAGAALLESKGTTAFQELSEAGSKWFKGSRYLFAYDLKCNVLFNAASPEKVGKNTRGHPDKNGKLFHDALVAQADMPDECGWVDYMWPKPGQDKPSQKWTYSKAVTIDGKRAVLMSGFY